MVSNPSASLKKARQAALDKNDGSLFGIVPLGKLERKKSRAVTESDCAAAFGEWRVALVRVFSDLFLLHCLFGFKIEEAGNDSGNPFTSSSETVECAEEVLEKLIKTERGCAGVLEDMNMAWSILCACIDREVLGTQVATLESAHGASAMSKIAGLCSLLMVRYASGGAAASWGAFERLANLARKPVQLGGVSDRASEIVAAARNYQLVYGNSVTATELKVSFLVELFRENGLGNKQSAQPLQSLACTVAKSVKSRLLGDMGVDEMERIFREFSVADTGIRSSGELTKARASKIGEIQPETLISVLCIQF